MNSKINSTLADSQNSPDPNSISLTFKLKKQALFLLGAVGFIFLGQVVWVFNQATLYRNPTLKKGLKKVFHFFITHKEIKIQNLSRFFSKDGGRLGPISLEKESASENFWVKIPLIDSQKKIQGEIFFGIKKIGNREGGEVVHPHGGVLLAENRYLPIEF